MRLDEIVEKFKAGSNKTASVAEVHEEAVEKTAYEQGAMEAENMVKVAAALGDIIGNRVADVIEARITESFGYSPEVCKTASLQDIMYDAMYKVAEQVGGTAAQSNVSTTLAEEAQIGETAAHHANLAAASAADAVQSLAQGDEHTATQALATAGQAIETAKELASRIPANAAVAQHVNDASAIVSEAASIAAGQAGPQA